MTMNTKPLISIIVPCYNQGKYIAETIDSIVTQTYAHWECIIVNDGSTDNSDQVIRGKIAGDGRFKYINQPNKGTSAAKNEALRHTEGDYIQVLDADDILMPRKLEAQVAFMALTTQTVDGKLITYTSSRFFYKDDTQQRSVFRYSTNFVNQLELSADDTDQLRSAIVRNPVQICTPLYPRKMFEELGDYDEQMHALEDWDIHIRAIAAGYRLQYIGYTEESMVLVRIHADSATNKSGVFKRGYDLLFDKHHKLDTFGIWSKPDMQTLKHVVRSVTPPFLFDLFKRMLK